MKENDSCHGERKKKNLREPITGWSAARFFKKAAVPSEKTERVMEVEGRPRCRIYIKLFNKHSHRLKSVPDGLLTREGEQSYPGTQAAECIF